MFFRNLIEHGVTDLLKLRLGDWFLLNIKASVQGLRSTHCH